MITKTLTMDEFGFDSIYEHIAICIAERGLTLRDVNTAGIAQDWIDYGCQRFETLAIIGIDTITITADTADEYLDTADSIRAYFEKDDEIFNIIDNNIIEY